VVLVDPHDPNTLFAGTYGGGAYKSVDAVASWHRASNDFDVPYFNFPIQHVVDMVLDPTNAAVVYASTNGGGFFKSTDGGIVYAISNTYVLKSTDGGTSWTPIKTGDGFRRHLTATGFRPCHCSENPIRLIQPFTPVPNQLAKSKRRQSLAEHEAVLAALAAIARYEETSVMALLRQATRELIRKKAATSSDVTCLREVVWAKAPRMPARFVSAAHVARFKRAQREFDRVLLDLDLTRPADVQARNSIVPVTRPIRILELERAHATAAR
jgi:hypothetical protein